MRTLKYRNTYGTTQTDVAVFDIKVQEHFTSTIVAVTSDPSGGTLKVFYVFTDDNGEEEVVQIGSSIALAQDTLVVTPYGHKISHMRLTYTGGSGSGTVRIDATTAK